MPCRVEDRVMDFLLADERELSDIAVSSILEFFRLVGQNTEQYRTNSHRPDPNEPVLVIDYRITDGYGRARRLFFWIDDSETEWVVLRADEF